MSYEVDLGAIIAGYSLSPGWFVTVSQAIPFEFAAGQWYRLALALEADNSPGVSVVIADTHNTGRSGEGVFIGDDGLQNASMTVYNNGKGTASFRINWLSSPSHH
jgi:hypothetical protein